MLTCHSLGQDGSDSAGIPGDQCVNLGSDGSDSAGLPSVKYHSLKH